PQTTGCSRADSRAYACSCAGSSTSRRAVRAHATAAGRSAGLTWHLQLSVSAGCTNISVSAVSIQVSPTRAPYRISAPNWGCGKPGLSAASRGGAEENPYSDLPCSDADTYGAAVVNSMLTQ